MPPATPGGSAAHATPARTSTASCSRGGWAPCSATTSSTRRSGDLAFKPRDQWHTFWNAGDEPCRILEIISPGGFEHFFDELGAIVEAPEFDPAQLGELGARYGLEFQPDSVPRLCEEHGLDHPLLHVGEPES